MTTWYWGNGEEFEHYFPRQRSASLQPKKSKENLAEVEALLRAALEEIALSHPTSIRKLMEAPEGTPTARARGKRRTSELESDYDSWKPNYHNED